MINHILEIIKNEDTFNLFSNSVSPSIYDINKLKIKTLPNIKNFLLTFFKNVKNNYPLDSLYWNEATKFEQFIFRLFKEIEDVKQESNGDDNIIEMYVESIMGFTEDIDVHKINEQISYIIS
ncbi:hypothetical protein NCER_100106 [Vairimorpha ceranae BRL01]|uniref:Uncharacterized protein n=2 Tax=Vairimorpha ceranae TaxID=40302 RepID=C4V6R3_VAIC1|nr:hypothetical protein AAJ76_1000136489 [Vairimorpha ceranae]EEQ83108.1 hypothetical protein NCER_100106 [Vairimorpha ceranae BRL01]KAF5141698.1 hypothetical protein G9O61_00g002400 [Vairimorpha ceranae]KKO76695.1 hypothetical protein AAJ76_1000136489 [Vairimorpha ceranae]